MSEEATDGCPICNASSDAKATFAAAKVAEHIDEKASHDDDHREWVEEHTETGEIDEIRDAL